MVDVATIEAKLAGHPDDAHVAVPVRLMRAIVRDLRARDAATVSAGVASAIDAIATGVRR